MYSDWKPHLLLPVYVSGNRIQSFYKPYFIDSTCFQECVLVVTFRFIVLFPAKSHTIVDFSMKIYLSLLLINQVKSKRRKFRFAKLSRHTLSLVPVPHCVCFFSFTFFKLKRHKNLLLKTS